MTRSDSTPRQAGRAGLPRRITVLAGLALLLGACAQTPIDPAGTDAELAPEHVQADPEGTRDRSVIWGGQIVQAENLEDRTRLEIVSYPLDSRSQRPLSERRPGARFVVEQDGYLETAEFESGRSITVRGRVRGTESGRIGEARYEFPILEGEQLHLWPRRAATGEPSRTRFNFGIGIMFSR